MSRKSLPFHYAWICCFAGALLFFISVGLSSNCYSVYQPFISEAYSLTQTQLSFMNTCRQISSIGAMVLLGLYYRKIKLKWGMILAASFSVLGFLLMSFANGYAMLLVACISCGFGNTMAGIVPISMILDRWFVTKRSLAVSLCSATSGVATFVAPSIITNSIETNGLHQTLLYQALLMAVLTLICALLFVDTPEKKHLKPYGEDQAPEGKIQIKTVDKTLPKGPMALVYLMCFLTGGGLSGCAIATLPLIALSAGYNSQQMALCVSLGGLSLMLSKIFYGILCEKVGQYTASMLYGFIMIFGLILLCFSPHSVLLLYTGSILYIGTLAMFAIGLVSWTVDWVEPKYWISYRQKFNLLFYVGCLFFSIIPGVLADRFGSYMPTVYILLGEAVVCTLIVYVAYKAMEKN